MRGTASLNALRLPQGATVLLRVDFNINIRGGKIEDDFRIVRALPTIVKLRDNGLRIVLLTHLEKDASVPTLRVLTRLLRNYPPLKDVMYIAGTAHRDIRRKLARLGQGIALLENTRRFRGEKTNDASLAHFFASLGEAFVNDAFAVSHREHASVVGIPELLPSYIGLLFDSEVRELSRFFVPPRPFFLIVGGKKISTKLALVKTLFPKTDAVFVGGAAANTLLEARGYHIGKSFSESGMMRTLGRPLFFSKKMLPPSDVIVRFNGRKKTVSADAVCADAEIVDVGPKTVAEWKEILSRARSVFWSGPLGLVEDGFGGGTIALARAIGKLHAIRIVGGGDTVTFFHRNRLMAHIDFFSTGGGAMLDFLSDCTLAGIEALRKSKRKFRL